MNTHRHINLASETQSINSDMCQKYSFILESNNISTYYVMTHEQYDQYVEMLLFFAKELCRI